MKPLDTIIGTRLMENITSISDLYIGQHVLESYSITRDIILQFGALTCDENPLHHSDNFSSQTQFMQINAHGMLIASYVVGVVGSQLPGAGWMCLGVKTDFNKPTYVGDVITVKVEVQKLIPVLGIAILKGEVRNQDGELLNSSEIKVKQLEVVGEL